MIHASATLMAFQDLNLKHFDLPCSAIGAIGVSSGRAQELALAMQARAPPARHTTVTFLLLTSATVAATTRGQLVFCNRESN
jgi:hypothetical protein